MVFSLLKVTSDLIMLRTQLSSTNLYSNLGSVDEGVVCVDDMGTKTGRGCIYICRVIIRPLKIYLRVSIIIFNVN